MNATQTISKLLSLGMDEVNRALSLGKEFFDMSTYGIDRYAYSYVLIHLDYLTHQLVKGKLIESMIDSTPAP